MDTTNSAICKLPLHEHPLSLTAMFTISVCAGCHKKGYMYGSYFCNEVFCSRWFHKECAEAPLEINHHPSHPEHPLLLTNDSPTEDDTCDFCGQNLLSPYYTCPTCEFKVDFTCGFKPSPSSVEHPACHDHPLVFLKKRSEEDKVCCEVCKKFIRGPSYSCRHECNNVYIHLGCVHLSKEVNHPCHPNHPLKLIPYESLDDEYAETNCRLCSVKLENMVYRCSICNFTICIGCTKNPPPLVVDHSKTHMHPLRLVASKLAFTCKVCGIEGYKNKSYICLECDFVIHGHCVGFPRVININRHDHRISFTHHLGRRGTKCGVCRRNVSQYYGAYSCSVCPNYTVHTRCALNPKVWNFVELEGIPEKSEDITPFKVVGHNLIRNFSHSEHSLRLLLKSKVVDESSIRCQACIGPVGLGKIYICEECHFVLHEKCANLLMKKRLVFKPKPYMLEFGNTAAVSCMLCGMLCDGFKYIMQGSRSFHCIDIHCGSLSEPFFHNAHLDPLYFVKTKDRYCLACKRVPNDYMLVCRACEFYLCLYCATLPEKIWDMSDEHPLTLSFDVNASGHIWCDVCESELDPSKWFYACCVCEIAFHVRCVLGDFSRLMPGNIYNFDGRYYKAVLNNRYTRPFCSHCHFRCKVPVILKECGEDNGYICSKLCVSSFLGIEL